MIAAHPRGFDLDVGIDPLHPLRIAVSVAVNNWNIDRADNATRFFVVQRADGGREPAVGEPVEEPQGQAQK